VHLFRRFDPGLAGVRIHISLGRVVVLSGAVRGSAMVRVDVGSALRRVASNRRAGGLTISAGK
jgi:hypothetical protein